VNKIFVGIRELCFPETNLRARGSGAAGGGRAEALVCVVLWDGPNQYNKERLPGGQNLTKSFYLFQIQISDSWMVSLAAGSLFSDHSDGPSAGKVLHGVAGSGSNV